MDVTLNRHRRALVATLNRTIAESEASLTVPGPIELKPPFPQTDEEALEDRLADIRRVDLWP